MKKNVSGQKVGAQLVSATDGSAFTGSVTVAVTVDAGTQATGSVGSGACTHEGGGYHTYAPAQAETNGDLIAFTFSGTGAVPVTVQIYTLPTTGILAPATLGRTLVVDSSGLADANVVNFGGVAGTLSGGRPEVNTTHIAGTAWASTTLFTLASHDPGATLGTSTLTQTQVTGGAYALNSASFAFNAALPLTTQQKADVTAAAPTAAAVTTAVWAAGTRTLTAGTNIQLPSNGLALVTAWAADITGSLSGSVGSVTGNVGGNVVGSVGSISGVTFPTNFGSLGINASGHVSRVVLADTLTTYTGNTPQTGDSYAVVTNVTYGNSALKTLIDTLTTYVDTEVAAIKAKTDNLPVDPADASDIAASFSSIASTLATIAAYIDTEVAAIKAKTDNLPTDPADASDVAASFATVNTKLDTIDDFLDTEIAAIKAKTDALPTDPADQSLVEAAITSAVSTIRGADNDTLKTISDQVDASDAPTVEEIDTYLTTQHGAGSWATGGSGAGAFTLTITVNDGATALQNATIRLTEGVNTYTASTNASGVAVFALDAATYAVAITKGGYQFTPTTKAVSATGSQTYSMTATTVTPSTPPGVTGTATTLDEDNQPEAGVSVVCKIHAIPSSATEFIHDLAPRTRVSNGIGLVTFTDLIPGVTYSFSRGAGTPRKVVCPDENFEIGGFAGTDPS